MGYQKGRAQLIRNMPGDTQPVNLIEDCAVSPEDLPSTLRTYKSIKKIRTDHILLCSLQEQENYMEPMINLKTKKGGKRFFRNVLKRNNQMVKKYNGSLNGEKAWRWQTAREFISSVLGEGCI